MKTVNDFPIEIKEKMMDEQEAQGNKRDWSVFEKNPTASRGGKGFVWSETALGNDNWSKIIKQHNYEPFYNLYPKNMNKIEKIQHQLNVLQKEVDELKKKETEPQLFVPKEIGIFLIRSKIHLIFNNQKVIFYGENNFFEIQTNDENWHNDNTGDNIQLIKTTFKEIKDGEFFLDDIDFINDFENYDLKTNGDAYYINDNNEIIFDVFDDKKEVYKLKLI